MAKLFVSCPMRGKGSVEILAEQEYMLEAVKRKLGRTDIELVKSMRAEFASLHPLACLGNSLILLAGADFVAFGRGWEEARGCKIEHDCAEAYGIPIINID